MKRITVLLGAVVLLLCSTVIAAVPQLINFQGILRDGSGNPVANGSYSVVLTIYDAPTGGTNLWSETQSVNTTSGLFNVNLGSVTPLGDAVFSGTTRYLGIKVGADPEMLPRTVLVSVPYSHRTATVDGASGGNITSKVSIGSGHTNTGADAFAAGLQHSVSGDYAAIGGGAGDTATGLAASIGGGTHNFATGAHSTVGGGRHNRARGDFSVIAGGGGPTAADSNSAFGVNSTIGGGLENLASGDSSTIGGGKQNSASGLNASVSGGVRNTASAYISFVGGGQANSAGGGHSSVVARGNFNSATTLAFVGGGGGDTASGANSVVVGGGLNVASGHRSAIGGGTYNRARGNNSVVAGGGSDVPTDSNAAIGDYSTVGGGRINIASGVAATIAGGQLNTASGLKATVGGGLGNKATEPGATVAGGTSNVSNGLGGGSTVGGGELDTASGAYSTVPGGWGNKASGNFSFVAGRRAKAIHDGSFVWGDNTDADFASTGINQFLIRASRGVGIETNSPGTKLHIASNTSYNTGSTYAIAASDSANQALRLSVGYDASLDAGVIQASQEFVTFNKPLLLNPNAGRVGIGTTAPQGALDVSSTTGAFIVPRMTTAQRNALTAVNGMIIYNTDAVAGGRFEFRENGTWVTK